MMQVLNKTTTRLLLEYALSKLPFFFGGNTSGDESGGGGHDNEKLSAKFGIKDTHTLRETTLDLHPTH